jgi:hypothetical protein
MSRLALLVVLVLALAVPTGWAASNVAGTLSIEDARGIVTVRGSGTLVGRLDKGELVIVDLSPADQWSPRINGVPRARIVGTRGKDVNFFVPGGRYRVVVRGEGIAISARGVGYASLKARPGPDGDGGVFSIGDEEPEPLPDDATKVTFGTLADQTSKKGEE